MSRTPDRPYRLTELRHNELILVPFRHPTRLAASGPWGALRQIAERIVRPVAHHGALDGLLPASRMGLPVAQHPADTSPVCASSTGGRVRMLGPSTSRRPYTHCSSISAISKTGSSTTVPLSLDKDRVKDFVGQHPSSLVVCRVCPNTRKHMVRDSPRRANSAITSIESGPKPRDCQRNGVTGPDTPSVAWRGRTSSGRDDRAHGGSD